MSRTLDVTAMSLRLSIRRRVAEIVNLARPGDCVSRVFDVVILVLIGLNVLAVILESMDDVQRVVATWFVAFEAISVALFSVEYVLRVWSCVETPGYEHPVWGRLRYALRPMMIVDLLAVLPAYLWFVRTDLRFFRVLRMMRIFRVLKLARYSRSLQLIGQVMANKREELVVTVFALAVLLVLASCLMYQAERAAQPEVFSSIPAAMWWAATTLTTVGYGDAYPVTVAGRLIGGVIAVLGIGMFALPAGIIASGFTEALREAREGTAHDRQGRASQQIKQDQLPG